MQKPIKINQVDVSEMFRKYGYYVEEIKVTGPNSGTMINGDEVEDILQIRDNIYLPLMPLTEQQNAALMSLLRESQYVTITYYSPTWCEVRTTECIREPATVKHLMQSPNGKEYFFGDAVLLRERKNGKTF